MTLAEAIETIKKYCKSRECDECVFHEVTNVDGDEIDDCTLDFPPLRWKVPAEPNLYDEEEIHENCTVQILRNSVTGEESIGWWENE